MSSILTAPLFAYDKSKNLLLKAVLPFLIIVHHVLIALPSNGYFRIFGNCNVWLGFVGTVTLSVGLYYIALRFALTRRFLCGEIRKP